MRIRHILNRLVFLVVGLFFISFALMAVCSRGFKTGIHGTTGGYVSAGEQPVKFWTIVIVATVLGLVAVYQFFKRQKHDA